MAPRLRKLLLMAHLTCSLGWLGAVVAYLALAWSGLSTADVALARSAYLSMELLGWGVIVPFSAGTLATGLVQSLGTEWGLFRHYWITLKFLLASVGSVILLTHLRAVSRRSDIARATSLTSGDFGGLRVQLVVHAVGGLLLLLAATALSIYKPWGLTPYGRRKPQGGRSVPGENRTLYVALGVLGLILALLILHHLLGGGPRHS